MTFTKKKTYMLDCVSLYLSLIWVTWCHPISTNRNSRICLWSVKFVKIVGKYPTGEQNKTLTYVCRIRRLQGDKWDWDQITGSISDQRNCIVVSGSPIWVFNVSIRSKQARISPGDRGQSIKKGTSWIMDQWVGKRLGTYESWIHNLVSLKNKDCDNIQVSLCPNDCVGSVL